MDDIIALIRWSLAVRRKCVIRAIPVATLSGPTSGEFLFYYAWKNSVKHDERKIVPSLKLITSTLIFSSALLFSDKVFFRQELLWWMVRVGSSGASLDDRCSRSLPLFRHQVLLSPSHGLIFIRLQIRLLLWIFAVHRLCLHDCGSIGCKFLKTIWWLCDIIILKRYITKITNMPS